MTTTVLTTDLTTSQTTDGNDTILLTEGASVIVSGGTTAFDIDGVANTIFIDGLAVSEARPVYLDFAGTYNSVTIGHTGRVIGLRSSEYALFDQGNNNVVINHGNISGLYGVGLDGDGGILNNTGLI